MTYLEKLVLNFIYIIKLLYTNFRFVGDNKSPPKLD